MDRYPQLDIAADWNLVLAILKIFGIGAFSILSVIFLIRNFEILGADSIKSMYSTLYHNLDPNK